MLEDEVSSTRLRGLLGCGKPAANFLENKGKKSEIVTYGRTSMDSTTPEVISLGCLVEGRGAFVRGN